MSEGVAQPGADHEKAPEQAAQLEEKPNRTGESTEQMQISSVEEAQTARTAEKIIWTPGFLLTFALIVVLGVSAESLFASGWGNGLPIAPWWVMPIHILLVAAGWTGLGIVARSRWTRIGCIFGGFWTLFMSLDAFMNMQGINPGSSVQSYINAAICMALLGAYIGLSIESAHLTRWDAWLFFLVPVLSAVGVALTYFLTPQASILTSENAIAAAALIACCLFWWLRPSCWKRGAGPTFLFGLVPAILLCAALLNTSMHDFFLLHVINGRSYPRGEMNNFFFAQASLLCLSLGCLRLWKSEKAH